MGNLLVTATFNHVSGFAEDAVQNSFCIDTPAGPVDPADLGEVTTAIHNFYVGATGGDTPISAWLAGGLSRAAGGITYDCYDITGKLGGANHGSPVFTDTGQLGSESGGPALPEEVALAITLRAANYAAQPVESSDGGDAGSEVDRPRQRYTGRIFIGPLNSQVLEEDVAFKARPVAAFRTSLTNSCIRLDTALRGRPSGPFIWSVWSRKDAVTRAISHVQVDNAFDTQRRRGTDPSVRTTVALPH